MSHAGPIRPFGDQGRSRAPLCPWCLSHEAKDYNRLDCQRIFVCGPTTVPEVEQLGTPFVRYTCKVCRYAECFSAPLTEGA